MASSVLAVFIFIFLLTGGCSAESRSWKQYKEAMLKITDDPAYKQILPEHVQMFKGNKLVSADKLTTKETFPCQTFPSNSVPSSVHSLLPGDIKVVAAMGDSITAGNGINAWTPIGALIEYRGHSWSIGGVDSYEEGIVSLPNILKHYNPNILGFSTGTGGRDSSKAKLNVAEPGNVSEDMPFQARLLVDRIKAMPEVDIQNDWKLVTLFIGGNDLCEYCYDMERFSIENYQTHLQEALDILQAELPRTFVNLVSIFDVTPVAGLAGNIICSAVHWAICSCGTSDEYKDIVSEVAFEYSRVAQELVESGRYDGSDDFTVVFQPFMRDNDVPRLQNGEPDYSYFAPDCFHFSAKGHHSISKMLWNALFEPVGQKSTQNPFDVAVDCPGQNQYLATVGN